MRVTGESVAGGKILAGMESGKVSAMTIQRRPQ